MATQTGKRPLPPDGEDSDAKRICSNNGSPAPPPSTNGLSDMERKRAEARARMDAVKARLAASKSNISSALPPADDVEAKRAAAQRKIEEMKAKMAAKRGQGQQQAPGRTGSPAQTFAPTLSTPQQTDSQKRVAEARARIAQMRQGRGATPTAPTPPQRNDDARTARGGLGIGLHPSLMGDMAASKARMSVAGPARGQQETKDVNPYLSTADAHADEGQDENYDATLMARRGGERKSKQLIFNQKGKFMAQANALRQQSKLEDMKRRIAAEARKTEIEEASDKAFLVPVPPEVEWWDEGLIAPDGSYKIDGEDTIITALVQHPVILQAPQDKFQPPPKPLMLTPQEQKKLRRQRRMADMKEEQAKIRLGLVEPPPPKVKKSNMMRVLGEQAVKDPTAVEARVNREIAQRAADHARANADRQLTKEQRVEKLKLQQAADEAKGIKIAVFRVDNLSSGKHRYQVDVHAKQNELTGIVVLHPEMNLIVVEGGAHAIKNYTKLMLNRIKWTENTLPLSNSSGPSTFTGSNDGTAKSGREVNRAAQWLNPMDDSGNLKDLSDNRCLLVWEGSEAQRSFKRWGSRACETDGEARDVLQRSKMETMWTLARSMTGDEE